MQSSVAVLVLLAVTSVSARPPAEPATVRVRLETSAGPIILSLDYRHAPVTVTNFLKYVDDGRLDGTEFYRASRKRDVPSQGFIQGGIGTEPRRKLPAVDFESTQKTGLHHVDGAISMARGEAVNLATCNFSLLVGPHEWLDAGPRGPGYAVFGRVSGGMGTVKRVLAMPTGGGVGPMRGQMLLKPVKITHAVRLDGTAKPTGWPKTWLMALPERKVK
jgi:peptidyl-prolyl cis-trans isomerase A (cyclophilin A)